MRRLCVLIFFLMLVQSQQQYENTLLESEVRNYTISGCPEEPNAVSIEITHPGSGSVPSDQHLQLTANVKDSSGQTMGVFPVWGALNGTITSNGLFSPHSTGDITIWACIGDVNQTKTITVLQGTTVDAELQLSSYNVSADEIVQLIPMKIDAKGNRALTFTPTENYTIPEGSNITSGTIMNWVPGPVGNHTIVANILGYVVSTVITVQYGAPASVEIFATTNTINADQSLDMSLSVLDIRGNAQPTVGEWYSQHNSSMPLTITPTGAQIEGLEVGVWRVYANYTGEGTNGGEWTDFIEITVESGSLTATRIDGFIVYRGGQGSDLGQLDGTIQITTDDKLVLHARLEDADGNTVNNGGLTWKLEANHLAFPETSSDNSFTFEPTIVGNYMITLTPFGGVPERITLEVGHGEATAIEVFSGISASLIIEIGSNLTFEVLGIDGDGNKFPLDVEWFIPAYTGNITNGSQGVGNYVFTTVHQTPIRLHTITAQTPLGPHDVPIDVRLGQLHHLMIEFEPEVGVQGEELSVMITGRDTNDNLVAIAVDEVSVSSSAGPVRYSEGTYYVELDESGIQHQITAEYADLPPEVVFVDVDPTIFGGVLGSSETVVIGGIGILSVLLLGVAIIVYRMSGKRRKTDEELIAEMEGENSELLVEQKEQVSDLPATSSLLPPAVAPVFPTHMLAPPPLATPAQILPPLASPNIVKIEEPKEQVDLSVSISALNLTPETADQSPDEVTNVVPEEEPAPPEEIVEDVSVEELPDLPEAPELFQQPVTKESMNWGDDDPFGDWGSGVANARALGLIDTYNGPMIKESGELLEPEQGTTRGKPGWYRLPDGTRVEWKG